MKDSKDDSTIVEIGLLMSQKALLEKKINSIVRTGVRDEIRTDIDGDDKFRQLESLHNDISQINRQVSLLSPKVGLNHDESQIINYTVNFTVTKNEELQ